MCQESSSGSHKASPPSLNETLQGSIARKQLKRGGILRSKYICDFNTFFIPHQREFALEIGVDHPSLTLWLDP